MAQRSFKLPDELDDKLKAKAEELDRPVSWVIVRAVEQALSDTDEESLGFRCRVLPR